MRKRLPSTHISFIVTLAFILAPWFAHSQKSATSVTGYGKASYNASSKMVFMREWLVAGPYAVGETEQERRSGFRSDDNIGLLNVASDKAPQPITLNGTTHAWVGHSSSTDGVNFDKIFQKDYAAAYALAELKSAEDKTVFLGIGSDDALRVWLNGKLVHNNWIARGMETDDDIVALRLKKGSNQLLIKVQDQQEGWGFICRILDDATISAGLIDAVLAGDYDQCKMMVEGGVDVNRKNKVGLSPLGAARLSGRKQLEKVLTDHGANDASVPSGEVLTDQQYVALQMKKAPGIALLVSKDGEILYSKGFGFADIGNNQPITPQTKFRIGSITKQFTSAAILKLQEERKISVKDKLSKFIPDFPRGNEVTIHHLLTHTSGIQTYTGRPDFVSRVTSGISEDDLVTIIKQSPYDFNPGERYLYNNSGYFLLGHIIRLVTGKAYGEYLKEVFFDPIGMVNTGVHSPELQLTQEAKGYMKQDNSYSKALDWNMSWAGGAGALYSTVEDLNRWNEAVFGGKVLKPESLKAAHTSVTLNNGQVPPEIKYGYGWVIQSFRGTDVIAHSGGLHGFSSQIARVPAHNLSVVMLTNLVPAEVMLDPTKIIEYFLWEKLGEVETNVSAAIEEDVTVYEGRYDFGNGAVMTVTSENDQLYAQLTGQQRFPIFASAPGSYFWKVVDAKITFLKDEKGEVTHADFSQSGRQLKVSRMSDIKIAKVDPALYDRYVGKYDYGNSFFINIIREGEKLYAQGTNQPRFEIVPVSETEFASREVNAKFSFEKENPGQASKLILEMAGRKQEGLRVE